MRNNYAGGFVLVALLGGGCSVPAVLWGVFGLLTKGNEYYAIPLFWGLIGCALFLPVLALWRPGKSQVPAERSDATRPLENRRGTEPPHPSPSNRPRKAANPAEGHLEIQHSDPSRPLPVKSVGPPHATDAPTARPTRELATEATDTAEEPAAAATQPADDLSMAERMEVRFMTVAGLVFFGFALLFALGMTQEAFAEAAISLILGLLCFRRLDKLLRR